MLFDGRNGLPPQQDGPVAAQADLEERDAEVERQLADADVGVFEEVELRARVVQDREEDVLPDDQQRSRPHASPVLVDDHRRPGGEEEEVLLGHAVQLVDVQRDEHLQCDAGRAAREERARQEAASDQEHPEAGQPDREGDEPRVVEARHVDGERHVGEQQPLDEAISAVVDPVEGLLHIVAQPEWIRRWVHRGEAGSTSAGREQP
ncbi:MAG: hypothetical protein ABL997_04250 [Planctomycetota bacterium]